MSLGVNQHVMVAVRVRPTLSKGSSQQVLEKFELQAVHQTGDTTLKVELSRLGDITKSSIFTFDYIFDQESTQLEVYEDAVVEMVDGALVGFNATVLAYGQTGAGKTFTVLGDVKPNPLENDLLTKDSGLFLRVLSDLFEFKIRQAKKGWHVVVGLSCIEVYCNNIRDLFGGKAEQEAPELKAKIINGNVFLPNLTVKEMTSLQAVFNEIQLAISRRQTRVTESNSASSRSHCIFSIDIIQQASSAPPPTLDLLDRLLSPNNEDHGGPRRGAHSSGSPSSEHGGFRSPVNDANSSLAKWEMPFKGTVLRVPGKKEPLYCSRIVLADLAGSERLDKSKVTGQGQKEATSINTSLTALGNVVHSLFEGSYANYRDSNLTILLKPSFAQPASRVLLLAQCSPTQLTFEETVSTLRFANKVKALKVVTTSGAEVDKLQFDYIEQKKQHSALCADLHIFALDQFARVPLIRRRCAQNCGFFYDASVGTSNGKAKSNGKDLRYAALEGMGVISVANKERKALLENQESEKREKASQTSKAIAEDRDNLVEEFKATFTEIYESIQRENNSSKSHLTEIMSLKYSERARQIMDEADSERATLVSKFRKKYHVLLKNTLSYLSDRFAAISLELDKTKSPIAPAEDSKQIEHDRKYALLVWAHCIAKRIFSQLMELQESKMRLLEYLRGNHRLEKWQSDTTKPVV
ncbi:unnamed protein product [Phytomonas sp. Hart1]|nr:unnamed protein product [Phytomonas sp. Hart1]|eukprot:CCW69411.1 unnamed protein product [Phytomonas sp. isolate Hart1]